MERLSELNVPTFRFDTDRFPTEVRLAFEDARVPIPFESMTGDD